MESRFVPVQFRYLIFTVVIVPAPAAPINVSIANAGNAGCQ